MPIFFVFASNTAYADDDIIIAADNTKTVPLDKLKEASLVEDISTFNKISSEFNLGALVGKKAAKIDQSDGMAFLHLLHLGDQEQNSLHPSLISTTDVIAKKENLFVIPKNYSFTQEQIEYIVRRFKISLTIYFDQELNKWVQQSFSQGMLHRPTMLGIEAQKFFNENSTNLNIFFKSEEPFMRAGLGDAFLFDRDTKNVNQLIEFKTSHKPLKSDSIKKIFSEKFPPYLNKQLLDFKTGVMYAQKGGYTDYEAFDLNSLKVDNQKMTAYL